MTVDIHVGLFNNLILNGSRSTDVNSKYQQQHNVNSMAFFNS